MGQAFSSSLPASNTIIWWEPGLATPACCSELSSLPCKFKNSKFSALLFKKFISKFLREKFFSQKFFQRGRLLKQVCFQQCNEWTIVVQHVLAKHAGFRLFDKFRQIQRFHHGCFVEVNSRRSKLTSDCKLESRVSQEWQLVLFHISNSFALQNCESVLVLLV